MKTIALICAIGVWLNGISARAETGSSTNDLAVLRSKAESGDAEAECKLGTAFEYSLNGIKQDWLEAAKWYRRSADHDFAEAYWRLGCLYFMGGGVEKNEGEAFRLFSKAAERNCAAAYDWLNACYYAGRGVSKDLIEAYKWLLLADRFGFYEDRDHYPGQVAKLFERRKAELTPEQIREATRLADAWVKQHKLTPPYRDVKSILEVLETTDKTNQLRQLP